MSFLRGYRTYFVGAGFIAAGFVKLVDGNYDEALQFFLSGLGAIFVRDAIAQIGPVR